MVTHEPDAIALVKLAPLTMPFEEIFGLLSDADAGVSVKLAV
jgi:hypothetical protein